MIALGFVTSLRPLASRRYSRIAFSPKAAARRNTMEQKKMAKGDVVLPDKICAGSLSHHTPTRVSAIPVSPLLIHSARGVEVTIANMVAKNKKWSPQLIATPK